MLLLAICICSKSNAADPAPTARYVLDYPLADAFCVPVRSYAEDVVETTLEVAGGLTQHMPNGGYGLPVVMKEQGQNLLHLGADVAWYRTGEPVFAIANGVVRLSQGPERGKKAKQQAAGRGARGATEWGNLVVIEHRLADVSFVTSIYGHLASKRLVQEGDVVRAGQRIGSVGRAGVENGGYKPHLHFAIRTGRPLEPGRLLLTFERNGQAIPLRVAQVGETEVEVVADGTLPKTLQLPDKTFEIDSREGKHFLPATVLQGWQSPEFVIVGYGLSTKGWRDPTEFFREKNAAQPPMP
jgi:hypothetical protein